MPGEARTYIGTQETWHGAYDNLWAHLDQRYANRWNLCAEAVRDFFFRPPPQGDKQDSAEYIFQQKSNLDHLLSLNLTLEEIGVSTIIQSLPEDHAREIRQALRTAHAGKPEKKHFDMKTLIQVTNDTIAVKHVSGVAAVTSTHKSTLGLATMTSSYKTPIPTGGKSKQTHKPKRKCYVCLRTKGEYGKHYTILCPDYPTAKSRREVLTKLKWCPYCAQDPHPGDCTMRAKNEGCKADKCVGQRKHFQAYCDHWEAELAAKVKPKK